MELLTGVLYLCIRVETLCIERRIPALFAEAEARVSGRVELDDYGTETGAAEKGMHVARKL